MPLRRRDGWWWLKAEITSPVGGRLSLDAVCEAISSDGIVIDVQQAHGADSFEPLANTATDVELGPEWPTRLRERAYLRSRRGRDAPDEAAF
jgi:hypothetical protein